MLETFLQTLPFFAIIGLGYGAARQGFFTEAASAALTRFVFYFALSAMIFRFSASLSLGELLDWNFILAYLAGTATVYALVTAVALVRGRGLAEAAIEAQCGAIGNTGFLGLPLLAVLMGEAAIGHNVVVLAIDLIVFSSLIVILVTAAREGTVSIGTIGQVMRGLVANPMIVSLVLGLAWSATGWPLPRPADDFLRTLGAAATPGALFAIGASRAARSAERLGVAGWLSLAKLALHPAAVAFCALVVWPVDTFAAAVMIAAAALPVAGNIYILAQHYGVAPLRVSAAILVSTAFSILTLPAIIAWVTSAQP